MILSLFQMAHPYTMRACALTTVRALLGIRCGDHANPRSFKIKVLSACRTYCVTKDIMELRYKVLHSPQVPNPPQLDLFVALLAELQ